MWRKRSVNEACSRESGKTPYMHGFAIPTLFRLVNSERGREKLMHFVLQRKSELLCPLP